MIQIDITFDEEDIRKLLFQTKKLGRTTIRIGADGPPINLDEPDSIQGDSE